MVYDVEGQGFRECFGLHAMSTRGNMVLPKLRHLADRCTLLTSRLPRGWPHMSCNLSVEPACFTARLCALPLKTSSASAAGLL